MATDTEEATTLAGEDTPDDEKINLENGVVHSDSEEKEGVVVTVKDDEEEDDEEEEEEEKPIDPFAAIPNLQDNTVKWGELSCGGKVKRVLIDWIGKFLLVSFCLYMFLIALDLMGDAFTVLGGTAAGAAMSDSELLNNPISGLMIGVLATVLLQSSSTTTSIIVSMVAADIIQVEQAIPMVMGANIGTSVTNTIVAMTGISNRDEFRRAFAGATIHDCFNWLSVLVFLPLEVLTGYLYHLTTAIVYGGDLEGGSWEGFDFSFTQPIVQYIIKIDKGVVTDIALGITEPGEESVVQRWCNTSDVYYQDDVIREINGTNLTVTEDVYNYTVYYERCNCLFSMPWADNISDAVIGLILLVFSIFVLCCALVSLVKILQSMLRGPIARALMKWVNADFPGYCAYFTGYVAIVVGALLTMMVQSSSVFTSTITPLVGIGFLSLDRMYPLTLGANIGTTLTSFIAAFASSDSIDFIEGVQISLCHLFFNISGILLWYPIPFMRRPPIGGAKFLGNTTAKYRWFAIFYLVTLFLLLPLSVFGLSVLGWQYLVGVLVPVTVLVIIIVIINLMQKYCSKALPKKMRTWDFLPKWLNSLEPYDNAIFSCRNKCKCCKCCAGSDSDSDSDTEADDVNDKTNLNHDDIEMVVSGAHAHENEVNTKDEKVDEASK
ncbi:sodium-dependent phosphate transport protein 2B-like [Glandiceps talaboti]